MRPTRPELGLRLRIAVVLATVCIVIIGTLGVTLDLASDDMEQSLVEQLVTEELESLVERTRAAQGYVAVGGPNLQYYVLTSKADYMQLPPEIRMLGPGLHNIGRGSSGRRVAIRDGDRRRYIVVYDEGPHEVRKARFRQLLLFCVLSAAAVAILLGYKFAGVLTRQLDELSTRVAQLAPDEPHPPLARPDHDREVAALAHALDAYHARLMEVMQREQEFTANTSHELRTPLTAIRTSCELLSTDGKLDDKARSRVEFVANAAAQMTESIEALLLLARREIRDEPESVYLRQCVAQIAAPYGDEMARKGLDFDLEIAESAVLQLNRKALQLVLGNLIKNAVHYTSSGFVRVSYAAQRLTVCDSGPGISPQHREHIFERYFRLDDKPGGLGLGLAIVRRICDDRGWKIELECPPGAGSAFTVVLA